MLERIAFYVLLAYTLIWHVPRFIRWLRKSKYTDDSFYEKQDRPNGPADFL